LELNPRKKHISEKPIRPIPRKTLEIGLGLVNLSGQYICKQAIVGFISKSFRP